MVDALVHQEDYSLVIKSIDFFNEVFWQTGIFPSHPHIVSESNDGISIIFLPVVPYCDCTCWVHVDVISVSCMSRCFVFCHLRFSSIITWVTEWKFHKTAVKHLNPTDEIYFILICIEFTQIVNYWECIEYTVTHLFPKHCYCFHH